MESFTYSITVQVPDGTDAGDVSLAMADSFECIGDARARTWDFGPFELQTPEQGARFEAMCRAADGYTVGEVDGDDLRSAVVDFTDSVKGRQP